MSGSPNMQGMGRRGIRPRASPAVRRGYVAARLQELTPDHAKTKRRTPRTEYEQGSVDQGHAVPSVGQQTASSSTLPVPPLLEMNFEDWLSQLRIRHPLSPGVASSTAISPHQSPPVPAQGSRYAYESTLPPPGSVMVESGGSSPAGHAPTPTTVPTTTTTSSPLAHTATTGDVQAHAPEPEPEPEPTPALPSVTGGSFGEFWDQSRELDTLLSSLVSHDNQTTPAPTSSTMLNTSATQTEDTLSASTHVPSARTVAQTMTDGLAPGPTRVLSDEALLKSPYRAVNRVHFAEEQAKEATSPFQSFLEAVSEYEAHRDGQVGIQTPGLMRGDISTAAVPRYHGGASRPLGLPPRTPGTALASVQAQRRAHGLSSTRRSRPYQATPPRASPAPRNATNGPGSAASFSRYLRARTPGTTTKGSSGAGVGVGPVSVGVGVGDTGRSSATAQAHAPSPLQGIGHLSEFFDSRQDIFDSPQPAGGEPSIRDVLFTEPLNADSTSKPSLAGGEDNLLYHFEGSESPIVPRTLFTSPRTPARGQENISPQPRPPPLQVETDNSPTLAIPPASPSPTKHARRTVVNGRSFVETKEPAVVSPQPSPRRRRIVVNGRSFVESPRKRPPTTPSTTIKAASSTTTAAAVTTTSTLSSQVVTPVLGTTGSSTKPVVSIGRGQLNMTARTSYTDASPRDVFQAKLNRFNERLRSLFEESA